MTPFGVIIDNTYRYVLSRALSDFGRVLSVGAIRFEDGRGFVHTSPSTEVTCRNKLRQSFNINKELFVNLSRYRSLGCRVSGSTEVACWPNS